MNRPKWQHARVLKSIDLPEAIGRKIWIKIEPPAERGGRDVMTLEICEVTPTHLTNLHSSGLRIIISTEQIELLARDENDFAEDVPLIPWEQFLSECRQAAAHAEVKND
jgi:hypothetical protein